MSDPTVPESGPPERQREIYLRGVRGHRPRVPTESGRLEAAAREVMSAEGFAYVAGGAGSESTMRENRAALERWRIVPRVLRDASRRDTSVELFGRRLPSPFLLAPIGVLEMAHPGADLAVARAAAAEGVPFVFSSQASVPMERTAEAMGDAPRWFQLYWSRSDALVESFVRRAEACGCEAIVVTLDTTLLGWQTRDLDLAHLPFLHGRGIAQYTSDAVFDETLPDVDTSTEGGRPTLAAIGTLLRQARNVPGGLLRNLRGKRGIAAVRQFVGTFSRPSLTWDDLPFLRERTRLPILLKGIQDADDGRRAADAGMDGVIVSNHGGRQVDGAVGSADALPGVVDAIDGRVPVLFDSGVRGGADVFRALALGADAVLLGRPYVYGLALAGEEGVREVIRNVAGEFELTLALAGCRSVADVKRDRLVRVP